MGLFNRQKRKPAGPYAKITVNVKYSYNHCYVPEIYYFDTPDDFAKNKQRVYDEYNVDREKKKIEAVIWDHAVETGKRMVKLTIVRIVEQRWKVR